MATDKSEITKLKWCFNSKNGIQIVEPSENLSKAYLMKAKESIRSMEVNAEAGIKDWSISASYYSRYFAVYSILTRIGIKCEIHDCTISLFEYLFENMFPKELVRELKLSKEDRIEAQYYTAEMHIDTYGMAERTKLFVLEIENLLDKLSTSKIKELQTKLENINLE
jgi:uncharacterized protein (UPF0332 family)